ncbi:DUF4328 domain-containing protein [Kitasatospora sp. NPDC059571]|uniref:DUF4328 domain-containing protein n=1 Tax=Kitasatospora sp. NPDC059571 TaxID=3346871 RepID=UPI00369ED443
MTDAQPADPREPATHLKVLTGLLTAGTVLISTAFLYAPSPGVRGVLGLCTTGLAVAYLIVRSVWIRRCWTNADLLAPGSQRSGRGWAVGGWFVPLVHLWLPRRVLVDILRAGGDEETRPVDLWWAVVVAVFLAGVAAMAPGIHETALLVGSALTVVKAVLFIRLVGRVTGRQTERLGLAPLPRYGARAAERA